MQHLLQIHMKEVHGVLLFSIRVHLSPTCLRWFHWSRQLSGPFTAPNTCDEHTDCKSPHLGLSFRFPSEQLHEQKKWADSWNPNGNIPDIWQSRNRKVTRWETNLFENWWHCKIGQKENFDKDWNFFFFGGGLQNTNGNMFSKQCSLHSHRVGATKLALDARSKALSLSYTLH